MEDFITEKFALLNVIKALQSLSSLSDGGDGRKPEQQPAAKESTVPEPVPPAFNVMADVIERHERISNRVHSAKK